MEHYNQPFTSLDILLQALCDCLSKTTLSENVAECTLMGFQDFPKPQSEDAREGVYIGFIMRELHCLVSEQKQLKDIWHDGTYNNI